MTVEQLVERTGFEVISLRDKTKKIEGCYAGDLLSWVMGRASSGDCWVTIMTNKNVLAVASLLDFACVIICDNSEVDETFVSTAESRNINVLRSAKPIFETCLILGNIK